MREPTRTRLAEGTPGAGPLLVVGATGLIGGCTARLLLARGQRVRALVRSPARARALAQLGAELAPGDLARPASLEHALAGAAAVLLVSDLNPEQVELQGNLVAAAARTGRAHIVKVSGFLTSADSPARSGRWHAATEADIDASGQPWTFLRAPFFMQNLLHTRPHAVADGELAMPLERARIAMVDARDIARAAAAALADPDHFARAYLLTGPEALDLPGVAARLARHSGRNVRFRTTSPAETRAALAAQGTPQWRIDVVMEFYAGFERGLGAEVTDAVARITGAPPTSLDVFLGCAEARAALAGGAGSP